MDNELNNSGEQFGDETVGVEKEGWQEATPSELAEAETSEMSYAGPHKIGLNKGTLILLGACVIGVGAMYLFGLRQKPKEASAQDKAVQAQVDEALKRLVDAKEQEKAKQLFKDTQQMVQTFYEYPTKQQVALTELQRDPFSRDFARDNSAKDAAEAQRQKDRQERDMNKKLMALKLQSVLSTPGGSKCLINGEVYGEGQKLLDTFVIKKISDGKVLLSAGEMEFSLQM